MKNFKTKFVGMIVMVILLSMLLPLQVLGANEEMQIVLTNTGDYIIYLKEFVDQEFDYAIAQKENAEELELNYINSVEDDEKNQVALITKDRYEKIKEQKNYLYVKTNEGVITKEINFEDAFDQEKMLSVEMTTKRITTEVLQNLEERNEEINGIQYTETVGGLRIAEEGNATYYYQRIELPAEKYSTLQQLADELNTNYMEKTMYERIEFAKNFDKLYQELINEAQWTEVENKEVRQPIDAQNGEQYIVLLKKVAENGEETYDVKFMTSYREDKEEKIPARTETRTVQETAKLPITGDSIILFVILVAIILVAVIVWIRMKKLQEKKDHQ